jgi:L-rhamnose isomerase
MDVQISDSKCADEKKKGDDGLIGKSLSPFSLWLSMFYKPIICTSIRSSAHLKSAHQCDALFNVIIPLV